MLQCAVRKRPAFLVASILSRPSLATMPNPDPSMDPVAPPLAAHLCETFLFGASILDALLCIAETVDSRGVLGIVRLLSFFHAVSIRANCMLFPILTRMQGAKGCPIAQGMLCWSCP